MSELLMNSSKISLLDFKPYTIKLKTYDMVIIGSKNISVNVSSVFASGGIF